jgi:hypothetical protein
MTALRHAFACLQPPFAGGETHATPYSPKRSASLRWATRVLVGILLSALSGCDDPDAQAIQGTVRLAPGVQAKIGGSDALFVIAREAGKKDGPPLAVLKMVGMSFPAEYRLSQEDVMMPGAWFRGKLAIKATLRKSGFVGMPTKHDLAGNASATVEPGAKGVDIELAPQ